MKKNKMLRIASILLVVTLLSTCVISGTFAKYVTKAEGEDQARVAKWGVLVTVEGGAFADTYAAEDEYYLAAEGVYSVVANNTEFDENGNITKHGDNLVAPGTSSAQIEGDLVATVKGTPEVAARYTLNVSGVEDVVLPAGKYTDYTHLVKAEDGTYGYTDTFELENDYSPVKWNLVIEGKGKTFDVAEDLYTALSAYPALLQKAEALGFSKNGCSIFSAVAVLKKVASNEDYEAIVNTALGNVVSGGRNFMLDVTSDGLTMSYDFDPNKEMDYSFTLSWEWAFEQKDDNGNVIDLYDAADTMLGNLAAGITPTVAGEVNKNVENAKLDIAAHVVATATQID